MLRSSQPCHDCHGTKVCKDRKEKMQKRAESKFCWCDDHGRSTTTVADTKCITSVTETSRSSWIQNRFNTLCIDVDTKHQKFRFSQLHTFNHFSLNSLNTMPTTHKAKSPTFSTTNIMLLYFLIREELLRI